MAVIIRSLLASVPVAALVALAWSLVQVAASAPYEGRLLAIVTLFIVGCIAGACALMAWAFRPR